MAKRSIFLALVLVVAAAAIAFAAKGGGSKNVVICAEKSDGALSLASKGKCGKGEKKLTIAKQGLQGPAGTPGSPGAAGTTASIQPEAVHLVTETGSDVPAAYCEEHPGVFCWESPLNWVNTNSVAEDAHVGFQKDAAGYIHLQGGASVTGGSGAEPKAIFFLPPGYRPLDGTRTFSNPCTSGGEPIEIKTSGAVDAKACAYLDGVSFHP
jgi:hypothetical protein